MQLESHPKLSSHKSIKVVKVFGPLYSVIIPFNDAFSHAVSIGATMSIYVIHFLHKHPTACVLIPSEGPLLELFQSWNIPANRIIVAKENYFYYSNNATLLFRKFPFNILQGHYPAHALSDMRNKTIDYLVNKNKIDQNIRNKSNNIVVYLWRTPQSSRCVLNQEKLG